MEIVSVVRVMPEIIVKNPCVKRRVKMEVDALDLIDVLVCMDIRDVIAKLIIEPDLVIGILIN